MLKKILTSLLIATFTVSGLGLPMAYAQPLLGLPEPGKMVGLSPAYAPTLIKGITVNKDNPFQFDFIVDVGQDKLSGEALKQEGDKLIKYFLASLAIPKEDLWVNLSPYEKDKTVPEALGQTDMGRDLLAQDYMLKQITASLIYPEKSLGKIFWDRVYAKSQELYGNTQIPVNTFNKVWITADQAEVFEHGQTAFVTKSHLKVLLETDYLALQQGSGSKSIQRSQTQKQFGEAGLQQNEITNKIIREIIIPELEKEVNEGKNFANLRQIFNSLILSSWYKNNLKEALLNQVYSNRSTVKGIDIEDKTSKEGIYNRYLQAYKKGVFNFIKEDTVNNQVVPKKYFSGGVNPGRAANPSMTRDSAQLGRMLDGAETLVNMRVTADTTSITSDRAQLTPEEKMYYNEIIEKSETVNGNIRVTYGYKMKRFPKLIDTEKMYVGINFLRTGVDPEERTAVRKMIVDNELRAFLQDGTHEATEEEIIRKKVLIYWIKEKWELFDDQAMTSKHERWEQKLKKDLERVFSLLAKHREIKDINLLLGVDVQIGPTFTELAKFLKLSEDRKDLHELYAKWTMIGQADQKLQEGHNVDLLKHNYVQGYFAYNFLLLTQDDQKSEYARWLKWKYYNSILLRFQNVTIDPTADYDPKRAKDSFLEKNPEVEGYQIKSQDVQANQAMLNQEISVVTQKPEIMQIINSWMSSGERKFNLSKEYYTSKINAAENGKVVVYFAGDEKKPSGILLGFRENNHWDIEIVEVERSGEGAGIGNSLVEKFVAIYGQDMMIAMSIDYIGKNLNGLYKWRKKLIGLGFYGTETQLFRQPDNRVPSQLEDYEFPVGMQTQPISKEEKTAASALVKVLRSKGLRVNKDFHARINEKLRSINLNESITQKEQEQIKNKILTLISTELEIADALIISAEAKLKALTKPGEEGKNWLKIDQELSVSRIHLRELVKDKDILDAISGKTEALFNSLFSNLRVDRAQSADYGGIDLKATEDNMAIKKENGDSGVQMNVDPAMIERIKREGIESLRPVIFSITPVTDIWKVIGLTPPLLPGSATQIIK